MLSSWLQLELSTATQIVLPRGRRLPPWMSMNRVQFVLNSNRRPIGPLCQIESTRKGHNVEVYKCAEQASNRSGCCFRKPGCL